MTETLIFFKKIILFGSILNVLSGPNFIQIGVESLSYDFKTGDIAPIYYNLNTENIGPKKVRFDFISNAGWIFVYPEGKQELTSKAIIQLSSFSGATIVLEIHPENLQDGQHSAAVTVNAVDINDLTILDTKEVKVAVNKNVIVSPKTPSATQTPAITLTPEPVSSPQPISSPTASPFESPSEKTPLPSPKVQQEAETKSPSPVQSPVTSREVAPIINPLKFIIESLRTLLRFFGI